MKYFSYDHHGNGMKLHSTIDEAKAEIKLCIEYYLANDSDVDDQPIDRLFWGEIAEKVDANGNIKKG